MARRRDNPEYSMDLQFPIEGVSDERSFFRQRQGTCFDAMNVTAFEPATGRARGGSRSGMALFMDDPLVTENVPIQCITALVSTSFPPNNTLNDFTYNKGSGSGVGLADSITGVPDFAIGADSGYQFSCSCWGEENDAYLATIDTTAGAIKVFKVNSSGSVVWTLTSLTCVTGSLRAVAGMVVVPPYLYMAIRTGATPDTLGNTTCRVTRIAIADGTIENATWRLSGSANGTYWSTESINCFARIGRFIGFDSPGYNGANSQFFGIYDTDVNVSAGAHGLARTAVYGGTMNHKKSKVVSDGVNFFYSTTATSTHYLLKISAAGVTGWAPTFASAINDICFDNKTQKLVVAFESTSSIKVISLSDGSVASTPSLGSDAWQHIISDGRGNFIRIKDQAASDDAEGLDEDFTSRGTTTYANVKHGGVSANQGTPTAIPAYEASRAFRYLAVSGGEVRRFTADGPVALTNGTKLSVMKKQIFAAQLGLNIFFVDGAGYWYYNNEDDAMADWEAAVTDGTIPRDSSGAAASLIEPYRGRLAIFGFPDNPQRYYLCKVRDALNWDFSPATTDGTEAIAATNSLYNYPGEKINALIPYTDDTAIFGDDSSIWMLSGDPAQGGKFDRIVNNLGIVYGRPWAFGRFNILHFMGSDGRVYKMTPGSLPIPISQAIDERLVDVDLEDVCVQMAYDWHGLRLLVWITSHTKPGSSVHYLFDERTNAWFPMSYANKRHNPYAVHIIDGDKAEDRGILFGGLDGRIYLLGQDYTKDGKSNIESWVILGPIVGRDLDRMMAHDMQAILSESSGSVKWEVFAGDTPEQALASTARVSGTWKSGFNPVSSVMESGRAVYIKVSSSDQWAVERITLRFATQGMVMRRI